MARLFFRCKNGTPLPVLAAQGHVQTVTGDVGKTPLAGDAALLPINSKG